MRFCRLGVLTLVSMALATTATTGAATELRLGARANADYDTDAFRSGTRRVNAWSLRVSPEVQVVDSQPKFDYSVKYRPEYRNVLVKEAGDGFTHSLWSDFNYSLGRQTQLGVSDTFRSIDKVQFVSDDEGLDETDFLDTGDDRSLRNSADVFLSHRFSRRISADLQAGHSLLEFEDSTRVDSQAITGQASASYTFDEETRAGLGVTVVHQDFESVANQAAQQIQIYEAFLSFSREFRRGWTLSLRGGPTLIESETEDPPAALFLPTFPTFADSRLTPNDGLGVDFSRCTIFTDGTMTTAFLNSCDFSAVSIVGDPSFPGIVGTIFPPIPYGTTLATATPLPNPFLSIPFLAGSPQGRSDRSIDFFARASLERDAEKWSVRITYTRSESDSAGVGSSTISDRVGVRAIWKATPRLTFTLTGGWNLRKSISDQLFTVLLVRDSGVPGVSQNSIVLGGMPTLAQNFALTTQRVKNAVKVTQWTAGLRASRALSERLALNLSLRYRRQISNRATLSVSHNYIGSIGLQYNFDPIRF